METEQPQPEKKTRRKPFKNLAAWTGLLRNFATIIASFISLATLVILLKQNERTYRPDLVFQPEQAAFRIRYQEQPVSCSDIDLSGIADSLPLTVQIVASNIGLGAAKDLKISWQFSPEQLVGTQRFGALTIPTQATYNADLQTVLFQNCFREEPHDQYAEFCLPVNMEKSPVQFALPGNYIHALCNILIRICHYPDASFSTRKDALLDAIRKLQMLEFSASYLDINNRRHSKNYRLQMFPVLINIQDKEMLFGWSLSPASNSKTRPRKLHLTISTNNTSHFIVPLEL